MRMAKNRLAPLDSLGSGLNPTERNQRNMGTTSLVVETVIIGFQSLVWIMLIIFIVFGYDWLDLSKLKDWSTIISLALLGVSYTLGIILSSFYGSLLIRLEYLSMPKFVLKASSKTQAYISVNNPDVHKELRDLAYRLSLVRGTLFNLI